MLGMQRLGVSIRAVQARLILDTEVLKSGGFGPTSEQLKRDIGIDIGPDFVDARIGHI